MQIPQMCASYLSLPRVFEPSLSTPGVTTSIQFHPPLTLYNSLQLATLLKPSSLSKQVFSPGTKWHVYCSAYFQITFNMHEIVKLCSCFYYYFFI